MYHVMHMELRGQLAGINFLLLACRFKVRLRALEENVFTL